MKKIVYDIDIIISLLWFSGCAPAVTTEVESKVLKTPLPAKTRISNLEWKPTMKKTDFDLEPLAVYRPISIALLSVNDIREDIRVIGKAYEDMKVRDVFIPLATKVNVVRWCKNAFNRVFYELGIKSDEKKGNLLLDIEITEISIFDDFTQTGSATLRINARTGEDMMIWEGQIHGTSDLYVHATDSDGISECLSNTIMVTVYNLFTDQSFRDAVIKAYE